MFKTRLGHLLMSRPFFMFILNQDGFLIGVGELCEVDCRFEDVAKGKRF